MSTTHKPWHQLPKPLKDMVARAVTEQGWTCRFSGGDHLTLIPPAGWETIDPRSRFRGIFLPKTPHGNGRTVKNYVMVLRRWGLK